MKILAVDTSEKSCSLALVENGMPLCEEFYLSSKTHSVILMDMVEHMIHHRAGISMDEIDGFAVVKGPGSFTGLRIGISVVKALAYSLSKPMAGISSLDCIAWQMSFSSLPVCVMMDAKRGEVYSAVYHFNSGLLEKKTEELAIAPRQICEMAGENALFAGSGALVFKNIITDSLGSGAVFVPEFQNRINAAAVAHVLFQNPELLSFDFSAGLPLYLRSSDAEINYKKLRINN